MAKKNPGGVARKKGVRVKTTIRLDARVYDMLVGDATRRNVDFNSYVNEVLAEHTCVDISYPPTRVGVNRRSAVQ